MNRNRNIVRAYIEKDFVDGYCLSISLVSQFEQDENYYLDDNNEGIEIDSISGFKSKSDAIKYAKDNFLVNEIEVDYNTIEITNVNRKRNIKHYVRAQISEINKTNFEITVEKISSENNEILDQSKYGDIRSLEEAMLILNSYRNIETICVNSNNKGAKQ